MNTSSICSLLWKATKTLLVINLYEKQHNNIRQFLYKGTWSLPIAFAIWKGSPWNMYIQCDSHWACYTSVLRTDFWTSSNEELFSFYLPNATKLSNQTFNQSLYSDLWGLTKESLLNSVAEVPVPWWLDREWTLQEKGSLVLESANCSPVTKTRVDRHVVIGNRIYPEGLDQNLTASGPRWVLNSARLETSCSVWEMIELASSIPSPGKAAAPCSH